jgi:nucleotide-binding universal stress UspA family protein
MASETRSLTRVLVAVHGYEPAGWARQAARSVQRAGADQVRIAAVLDVPQPPFTSLLPAARRRYGGAVAAWRHGERERLQTTIDALTAALGAAPPVVHLEARRSDPGRALAEHAAEWGADAVVVGRDTRSRLWHLLFGAADQDLLRHAPCAVLVAGPDGVAEAPDTTVAPSSRLQARA